MWGRFHLSQLFPSGFIFYIRASFPWNRAFAVFSFFLLLSLLLLLFHTLWCQPATLAVKTATRPAWHAEALVTGDWVLGIGNSARAFGYLLQCILYFWLFISTHQCLNEVSLILDALFNLTVDMNFVRRMSTCLCTSKQWHGNSWWVRLGWREPPFASFYHFRTVNTTLGGFTRCWSLTRVSSTVFASNSRPSFFFSLFSIAYHTTILRCVNSHFYCLCFIQKLL